MKLHNHSGHPEASAPAANWNRRAGAMTLLLATGLSALVSIGSKPNSGEALPTGVSGNTATKVGNNSPDTKASNSHFEQMLDTVSEKDRKAIQSATVRIKYFPTTGGHWEMGTGVLIDYQGETLVLTQRHLAHDVTDSQPFGMTPKGTAEFRNSNKAVNYSRKAESRGYIVQITETNNENIKLGLAKDILGGPVGESDDVMVMTFDSTTTTPALARKKPIPASKIMNTIPAKGTPFYLYGVRYGSVPTEAVGKMQGTARIQSVLYNDGTSTKAYKLGGQYEIIAGNWPSPTQSGCTIGKSGLAPIKNGGEITFGQSFEVHYSADPQDWQNIMNQVNPQATPDQMPSICAVSVPGEMIRTHKSIAVLRYLMAGRNNFAR